MTQKPQFRGNDYREPGALQAWVSRRSEPALEPDLPIIDPHHHFWDDDARGRYLMPDLLEDIASGHHIIATVFVETTTHYRADGPEALRCIGEVEFVNGIAALSASGRFGNARLCAGIVGHANLRLGDEVQPVLEALIAAGNGRLRGIRHGLGWDDTGARAGNFKLKPKAPRYLALDPEFRRGFAHLRPLGLSFDASLLYTQLSDLVDLLRAYPDTTVILNHFGAVLGIPPHDNRDEVFKVWRTHMRGLAPFSNLHVKVGGLGMLRSGWDFHLRETPPTSEELAAAWRPYIETCIETFGVDRCMLESNFPPDKQSCGYGVLWNAMKRITQNCSAAEKAALYRDTAARVYRIAI
jgi:L-fuconolactonase